MQSIFKTYNRFPFEIVKGEGVNLFDETGKKYLDLTSGIGVCNLGYSSKKVKKRSKCTVRQDLAHFKSL